MACAVAALLLAARPALGEVVSIAASKDNTIYSESGSLSNGAGQHFFAGRTGPLTGGQTRRALMAFDIAASVPAGSTVTSVTLQLSMSRTVDVTPRSISLHPVLADWGEGTSDATFNEGGGAPATPGDATWLHRFFDTTFFWATPGGEFFSTPSAVTTVGGFGFYTWGPAPQMTADVQSWLDNRGSNFGWILLGDESTISTTRRFDSRESATVSLRPLLTVDFTPPVDLAGQVPDGGRVPGLPLTIEGAAGGQVTLRWDPSCLSTDTDFEVYEGALRDFRSHLPRACTTGGATAFTLAPAAGNTYYLVVPRNASREGSYGTDSEGFARPASLSACFPQAVLVCQ